MTNIHRGAVALILSAAIGCGTTSGFLRDAATVNQHQYVQPVGAVRYLRSIDASSSIGSALCLIPVNSDPPYATTMAELHKSAKLQPNEVLENIREDHTLTTYLVYCISTLTLSADVIELTPAGAPIPTAAPKASPSSGAPSAAGPAATGGDACEVAFAAMPNLAAPLRRLYPNAVVRPSPPRATFLGVCEDQSEEVQACLQAAYLRGHIEECKEVFGKLESKDRRRLFLTFLDDFE